MILNVDTTSSVPVYAQIVEQIKRGVAIGVIRPGDALPSLRETALKIRVNPLTVAKAYKQLEIEGLVETRHGLGTFVSENAEAPAEEFRRDALVREVDALIVDSRHLGVGVDDLRNIVEERIRRFGEAKEDGRDGR